MLSFRPAPDGHYLARPRLLDELPDRPGFVVWLEAPYGYGKSVLASQWAEQLHVSGWRVMWLAAAEREPRAQLAAHVGLPGSSSWSLILDTVWQEPTLLVLEDLESLVDPEELTPLLRDVRGLVLLASRNPLDVSELPRLVTQRRLIHLGAAELGFTSLEAVGLFADAGTAQAMWTRTHGWPLPLHFASLAGSLPASGALLGGIRASSTQDEWQEALLLATLSYLPPEAAVSATRRLAETGFVQLGEAGYRLHALVAEAIVAVHHEDAKAVLRREAGRLPPLLLGEAFERSGDHCGLQGLLEDFRSQNYRTAPESFVRWDALLTAASEGVPGGGRPSSAGTGPGAGTATPGAGDLPGSSALRHLTVGGANKALGNHAAAVERLRLGLAASDLDPADELMALKDLCWSLALLEPDQAAAAVRRGEALLGRVPPELAGRFLSDASFVDMMAGDFSAAIAKLERSLACLPQGSRYRTGSRINLALNRWDLYGDYDHRLFTQTETLPDVWELYPSDAPGQCRDLAMLHWWAGDLDTARAYLRQAIDGARSNPLIGLEATAALVHLDGRAKGTGDLSGFAHLLAKAEDWGSEYTLDAVAMHALFALPADTELGVAEAVYRAVPEPALATAAYAPILARNGAEVEAMALVDAASAEFTDRDYRLYLGAARYRLTRADDDLETFLALTTAGARLLPGLIDLHELPRDRPELSMAYPLAEVLASGWKEAVGLRLAEVPELELRCLGTFELRSLGQSVTLTERQKQLVLLSEVGLSREQLAEALWPETETDKQRNNLAVQFNGLRKVLEPWKHSTFVFEDGLRHLRSDLAELLAALDRDDAEQVMKLYREPLAAGVQLDAIEAYRSELRARVVKLLSSAALAAPAAQATQHLARVMELEPLNEEALQALVRHLMTKGRSHDARRYYAAFEAHLQDEMGMEPLEATRALLGAR